MIFYCEKVYSDIIIMQVFSSHHNFYTKKTRQQLLTCFEIYFNALLVMDILTDIHHSPLEILTLLSMIFF